MSKVIIYALVFTAILVTLSACSSGRTVKVDAAQNPGKVQLETGDLLEIKIEGNPTTGYQWEYIPADDGILASAAEPEYKSMSSGSLVGGGGVYKFTLRAEKPGLTQVELKYYRTFEPKEIPPVETFVLEVEVR